MKMLIALAVVLAVLQSAATPQSAADELLATDRRFAAEAVKTTAILALSAMFADDVMMPVPGPSLGFARGKAQAIAALESNPDNATSHLQWTPVRVGLSADGHHGFTFGYMTMTSAGGKSAPGKYVAYWVKHPEGWRVAAYRRVPVDSTPTTVELLPPALPGRLVPPTIEPGIVARHKSSLEAAEKAFSDEAQKIGLGPAFAKHGSPDAMNVGPRTSPSFVIGAAVIAESVGAGSEGKPSPVMWAADEGSLVASSGDLGVTFGFIRQRTPLSGRPAGVPFFTIWRRPDVTQPWRYVAE